MKITKVMVNRKFNLGNYETLDIAAEAELNETDNPLEIWGVLKDNIEMSFIDMQKKKVTPQQIPASIAPSPVAAKLPAQLANEKESLVCACGKAKKAGFNQCYDCYMKRANK
jgi:hypothetical protein